MGYDGRITQPFGEIMPPIKHATDTRRADRLHFEERQQLRDKMSEFRYNFIDDLPSQRITRDDPNFHKYKCKSTFMTGLMGKLDIALREKVLISQEEVKIAEAYIRFVRSRAAKHRMEMDKLMTDKDRAFLTSQEAFESPDKVATLLHEKLWISTTRDEINFINQTLDALISVLSSRKDMNKDTFDSARAA